MRKYRCTGRRLAYHRPKTPAPKNGWLLSELAQLTELPETTVRYYLQRRFIEPIEIRGTASRYDRRGFLRVLGIMRLKGEADSTLAEKKRKLDAMGQEELERWLCSGPLPPAAAAALGLESVLSAQPQRSTSVPGFASSANAYSTVLTTTQSAQELERAAAERWERIALLPGLDLIVRANAREPARLVAQRICEVYSVK
jgi:DNA-binding transcriptional MerR regulator